jgi:hypothetical protein
VLEKSRKKEVSLNKKYYKIKINVFTNWNKILNFANAFFQDFFL